MSSKAGSRKVIIIVASLVIGVPLVAWVMWGVFVGFEAEPTPEDRALVLNAEDLRAFEPTLPDATGVLTRTEYLDGSSMLEFEYETDGVYVYSSLSDERSDRDARAVYIGMVAAMPLLAQFDDSVKLEARDELFSWGDQSGAKVFVYQGEPAGITIVGRKGRRVVNASVTGWAFRDPAEVNRLFGPWLARIAP